MEEEEEYQEDDDEAREKFKDLDENFVDAEAAKNGNKTP